MEQFVAIFNMIVGVSIIAMQAAIVVLVIACITRYRPILNRVSAWKKQLLFAVSAAALVGSAVYSNVIGYTACYLCWIQRIMMIGTATVSLFGIVRKSTSKIIVRGSLVFIALGTFVATYHTLTLNGIGNGEALCAAIGGISCYQLYVNQFGYISIPVMSLTVFVLLLIIALVKKPKE